MGWFTKRTRIRVERIPAGLPSLVSNGVAYIAEGETARTYCPTCGVIAEGFIGGDGVERCLLCAVPVASLPD